VVAGGLLAGCTDGDGSSPTPTDAGTATADADDASGTHTATMAPMGTVEFESVPESIFTRLTHLAGMAFALGRGNDVNAMHAPDYYDAVWNQFTPRLPGVSLDWSGLYSSWDPSKEKLYELDSDVHLADPASVAALESWSETDLDEVATQVGPWFGNTFSDRNGTPPSGWGDRYEYYGLWEMFGRVAEVFRAGDRYDALKAVRDDLLATIEADRPPESGRPTAAMALPNDFDEIYVYRINTPGFLTAHTRPFGAVDAFGDDLASGDTVDLEGLLKADPDVLLGMGGMAPGTDIAKIRRNLQEDPVGRELSAVRNDRVYAQGARYQGPILNLFQLEMTAKQLYPDAFGEWPAYESGPYPELPDAERLFDRERVAEIVRGEF
jgi:ABC-type Fe3+-hydroxamate transport system substrate-binding protein